MSARDQIITLPNPHLRAKSQRVTALDERVKTVIEKMKAAALDWEAHREHEVGVALAAVQIDEALKIIIIRNDFDDKEDHSFNVFINPKIVKAEGPLEEDFEGCLSVTDVYGKVPRYSKIRIRAQDENGQEVRIKAEGFLARIFQHEIDHINGKVFIDYIKSEPGAFYQLTNEGKLEPLSDEAASKLSVLR